ncbi:hypothetical protein C8R47DRAFT_1048058 [Mycena vitilis]|nr:hypothetical protein C8R47DRAFT_1048058 [Mycena vitilis]
MNMHKWHGEEGVKGLGGGIVSAASQDNLRKAEDLCQKRRPNEAVPFLLEAIKDPNNLDADLQMAFLCDKPFAVKTLENAEFKGRTILKQRLGATAFSDAGPYIGKFGLQLDTRPYMRILQAQVRVYFETGAYTKSVCPMDVMNQRSWLGSLLLRVGRYADALFFAQGWIDATEGDDPPLRGGTAFQAPRRELLSEQRERSLSTNSQWAPAIQFHTAALAAFRLWGVCPQASQYLRLAARSNPHILVKILGRRSQPTHMNMHSRGINSPEEAQDYLWLTQDLWTETQAWNWITNDATVNAELLKICSRAECTEIETKPTQFKRCAGCHQVTYCGPICQKEDWKSHKKECRQQTQLKKTIKEFEANKSNTTKIPSFHVDMRPLAVGGAPVMYDGRTGKFL